MSVFGNLMNKIFGHSAQAAPAAASAAPSAAAASAGAAPPSMASQPAAGPAQASAPAGEVDVAAILDAMNEKNPEELDWRVSIVDLMKLVGMDSSLHARKELASELHYTGDMNDSATMNIWLHKEVMKKIAANGGKIPAHLAG